MAEHEERKAPAPHPEQEDQLSPSRALRESAARPGGQRIGDSGPVANPETSFPDAPAGDPTREPED